MSNRRRNTGGSQRKEKGGGNCSRGEKGELNSEKKQRNRKNDVVLSLTYEKKSSNHRQGKEKKTLRNAKGFGPKHFRGKRERDYGKKKIGGGERYG